MFVDLELGLVLGSVCSLGIVIKRSLFYCR